MSVLGLNVGAQPAPDSKSALRYQYALAKGQLKASANWFDWIAALSVVNSLISLVGGGIRFVVGLGITTIVDGFAQQGGKNGPVVGLIITMMAAGMFWGLGRASKEGRKWALILGMALYALDGALILLWHDWLSIAFHAYALFRLYRAFGAMDEMEATRQTAASQGIPLEQIAN